MRFQGPHHLCGARGEGVKGVKGSEGRQREQRGVKGSEGGAKGSKAYSVLGFRVPTTWNEKSLITTCSV